MWLKIFCFVLLLSAVFGKDLKRSLKVDVKDAEVKIDNKADNGDEKAHVRADIRLNHNDGLFVKYSAKAKNSTTMVDVDFTVSFDSIVEFVYKNGEAYNPATDTATKTLSMDDVSWNKIVCNQDDTEWVCSSNTTGTTNKVGVVFKFSSEAFSNGPVELSNTDIKITLTVDNFQYSQENSSLALCFSGTSKQDFKNFTEGSHERTMGSPDFFFSWMNLIQADGVDVAVVDSPIKNSDSNGEKKFAFCASVAATNPKSLVYDPTIGISSSPSSSPATVVVPSLLFLLAVLFALL